MAPDRRHSMQVEKRVTSPTPHAGVIVCGRDHPLYRAGRIGRADLARHAFVAPSFFQRERT